MCVKEEVLFFCSKNKPQKSPYTMTKSTAPMRKAEPDAKKKFSKLCLICSNHYIIVAVCCVGCVFCPDCELSGSLLWWSTLSRWACRFYNCSVNCRSRSPSICQEKRPHFSNGICPHCCINDDNVEFPKFFKTVYRVVILVIALFCDIGLTTTSWESPQISQVTRIPYQLDEH